MEFLALFGRKHSRKGFLQIIENLVDDAIRFHVDMILLGHRAGGFFRHDIESDNRDAVIRRLGFGRIASCTSLSLTGPTPL